MSSAETEERGNDMRNRVQVTVRVVLLFISAVFISGQLQAQVYAGPKITVTELNHDFGKVVQGTQVTQVFEVRNDGNEQLVIERIQPS